MIEPAELKPQKTGFRQLTLRDFSNCHRTVLPKTQPHLHFHHHIRLRIINLHLHRLNDPHFCPFILYLRQFFIKHFSLSFLSMFWKCQGKLWVRIEAFLDVSSNYLSPKWLFVFHVLTHIWTHKQPIISKIVLKYFTFK